mmetsp:Transcript_2198/g.5166  ORF Transcript_2198/g.5166 Transcript_2198/m.5166 type:complete len:396 (+) Transcript_2198:159-1346(+)|eukprot:CAMPEP_0178988582 /NCGR_PEP_ID=MMETSP0795-20121207/3885_1 /TAXON_ID=88552 /ORGANISM="Amoebophrya sp., Strain Ameob2" /LENGTH=395 /DNA_ID=CAMNT_0020679861 /DNA_START=141 /DNA_END=1328 /DNA_ORIENTATION=-
MPSVLTPAMLQHLHATSFSSPRHQSVGLRVSSLGSATSMNLHEDDHHDLRPKSVHFPANHGSHQHHHKRHDPTAFYIFGLIWLIKLPFSSGLEVEDWKMEAKDMWPLNSNEGTQFPSRPMTEAEVNAGGIKTGVPGFMQWAQDSQDFLGQGMGKVLEKTGKALGNALFGDGDNYRPDVSEMGQAAQGNAISELEFDAGALKAARYMGVGADLFGWGQPGAHGANEKMKLGTGAEQVPRLYDGDFGLMEARMTTMSKARASAINDARQAGVDVSPLYDGRTLGAARAAIGSAPGAPHAGGGRGLNPAGPAVVGMAETAARNGGIAGAVSRKVITTDEEAEKQFREQPEVQAFAQRCKSAHLPTPYGEQMTTSGGFVDRDAGCNKSGPPGFDETSMS